MDSNVLGVNYNGTPCKAFYHPYECLFSDDVKRLHLRHYPDNEYVLLFFTAVFEMQRKIYEYGYKFNKERMKPQPIMLPVDSSGNPDYEYMEKYVQNLMLKKYTQYITYREST